MAIKKSELYSSLWASCDELRGGMDASQYKDYVLSMLFVKYVSDKYAGDKYGLIEIPEGASFSDMVALKGDPEIGDKINKQILGPIAMANRLPTKDFPDFNNEDRLGKGKEMVERLGNLIAIFQNPALDFSRNRADGDDLIGDAYEFLMRHFATESGKSKGQFYTPAEVSRIMAQIIGIRDAKTTAQTSVYDPTCGSGSLLIKVADEAPTKVSIYGQEKDGSTAGLARMNMLLHGQELIEIVGGYSTLAEPRFRDEGGVLKTFDFVVANPPFSDKRWATGFDPETDEHARFNSFGIPPGKQGDYAYLLHIVRSLKPMGKGACILPHGVLFRGNAEAEIRKNLIRKGYIKAIIGLPANLFYGTGIPACLVLIDKQGAANRKGIFMIDASNGFIKDGPKNKLRAQDIHKIVDACTRRAEIPKYSRVVSVEEIEKNEFNLNIPRYIDSSDAEDIQDLEGHLRGGIPDGDINALSEFWEVCPNLKAALVKPLRPGYVELAVPKNEIKKTIFGHPEFKAFVEDVKSHFDSWKEQVNPTLQALGKGMHPKEDIARLSESLLAHFEKSKLIDPYAVYQHLMDYWAETMQDDFYLIAAEGWKAEPEPVYAKAGKDGKQGKQIGRACDLIPKELIIARYFQVEQERIDHLRSELDTLTARIEEIEEEQSGDEGAFAEVEKISIATVKAHLKEQIKSPQGLMPEDCELLTEYLRLAQDEQATKQWLKSAVTELDRKALETYPNLATVQIREIVICDKWLSTVGNDIQSQLDHASQTLASRIHQLTELYSTPLPLLSENGVVLGKRVDVHLKALGLVWH